jgi:hypothetical protein
MSKLNRNRDDEILVEEDEISVGDNESYSSLNDEDSTDGTDIKTQELSDVSNDPILNADVFYNRRKMAWWSLIVLISLTIFLFVFLLLILTLFIFKPELMIKLTEQYKFYLEWSGTFIGWGYSAFTAIILAYMGVAAYFYNNYMKYKK